MNAAAMVSRYLFMRHTNVDGEAYVQQHRVWDAGRFIETRAREAAKLNADQTDGKPRLAKAEAITEEQFRKER